ncbi:MAG: SHOCT domain-containing protein [Syntrophales bacterium]
MYWGNYGHDGMGYGWGMGTGLGWLFMILFLILLILFAVYLIKLIVGTAKRGDKEGNPVQILKTRYARGEITREQYDGMKKDLES